MSGNQLSFADKHLFDECVRDTNDLMVPVVIRRCVSIERNSAYPDDPPVTITKDIKIKADVREVSFNEIAHSGGILITGDNILWCQTEIRGPRDNTTNNLDPNAVADQIIIFNQEFTIVGSPLIGRFLDTLISGYQCYIRRRSGGYLNTGDPAGDA